MSLNPMNPIRTGSRISASASVSQNVDRIPAYSGHNDHLKIELTNRESALVKEREAELQSVLSGQSLIRDWKHTFEELIQNEVNGYLKAQYPTFYWALGITADWRYRCLALITYVWFVVSLYVSFRSADCINSVQAMLTISTTPFLFLCTTMNTLANPWLFTGAWNGRINLKKINKNDPASNGYFRLLEAQLGLVHNLGMKCHGEEIPKEGRLLKLMLTTVPVGIIVSCIVLLVASNASWKILIKYFGEISKDSNCELPVDFQANSGFLLAPYINAAISMYACLVTICGLYVGSSVCGSMTASWCSRYEATKYLHESALPPGIRKHDLRSDAYERYFLIREFLFKSSLVWNHYLVIYMLAFFIIFLYSTAVVFLDRVTFVGRTQSLWQVLSMLGFVLPLYLVSTANSSSRLMDNMFRFSVPPHKSANSVPDWSLSPTSTSTFHPHSPIVSATASASISTVDDLLREDRVLAEHYAGNYSIIGGRTEWLEFIRDAPLYWTVLSIPVTFERLTTFILGTSVSLLAATLPRLLSNLSPPAK